MLTIDLDAPEPLYVQIVRGVKRAIARGDLAVGVRLPSVRQLAGDLAINLNTVARAYRQLEEEGFLRIRHGRGAVVVRDQLDDRTAARGRLREELSRALDQARLGGLTDRDLRKELRRVTKRALED